MSECSKFAVTKRKQYFVVIVFYDTFLGTHIVLTKQTCQKREGEVKGVELLMKAST